MKFDSQFGCDSFLLPDPSGVLPVPEFSISGETDLSLPEKAANFTKQITFSFSKAAHRQGS